MIWKRLKTKSKEEEEKFAEEVEKVGLEKNDMRAMIISALLVIMPVALIVLGVMVLLIFLLL